MAAKHLDMAGGLAAFNAVEQQGLSLPLGMYNSLLFIVTGGDYWEDLARKPSIAHVEQQQEMDHLRLDEVGQEMVEGQSTQQNNSEGKAGAQPAFASKDAGPGTTSSEREAAEEAAQRQRLGEFPLSERLQAAARIVAHMKANKVSEDDVTYATLARAAAQQGDADKALEWARTCASTTRILRLRTIAPALVGFALAGRAKDALEVDKWAVEMASLDLTDYEYHLLLEAVVKGGTHQQLIALLHRMSEDVAALPPRTVELLVSYFKSPAAAAAAGCEWSVAEVAVDAAGRCAAAGGQLQVVELKPDEWAAFADQIASLASKNQKRAGDFPAFMAWYERWGPFDVLVDGANVAFYGQNCVEKRAAFSWDNLRLMMTLLRQKYRGKRILLMLHTRRVTEGDAQRPENQELVQQLMREKAFYATPPGSNDDWYWMWGTVKARAKGLLISNDELRDHIFSLLRPKHFLKWKSRHIAHYTFKAGADANKYVPELMLPAPYTTCVQELSGSGAWMLPRQGEASVTWVCCKPVR